MPRTSPRTPLPRARSSLWPWQYASDASLLVHTVLPLDASRGHFGVADLGVQGLWVLRAYAPKAPGLLRHARAPLFGRGSMLQMRFCLCTQYCCNTRWKCPSCLLSAPGPNKRVWILCDTSGSACGLWLWAVRSTNLAICTEPPSVHVFQTLIKTCGPQKSNGFFCGPRKSNGIVTCKN